MMHSQEFIRRFEALAIGGVGPGLPRRDEDRRVLLKAVTLSLGDVLPCSERELGEALQRWLASAGPRVEIDPVSLRRALVDFGFLERDAAGRSYTRAETPPGTFAPEIDELAPLDLLADARQRLVERAARRAKGG